MDVYFLRTPIKYLYLNVIKSNFLQFSQLKIFY